MRYTIDAQNQTLGRVASQVSHILQGKQHAAYEPRLSGADHVVITNVSKLRFTGNKLRTKVYYRHTGYMGHLKERTLGEWFKRAPEEVMRHAIRGMLPKNKLAAKRLKRLTIER